ncbi:Transposase family Tnp2 protein [Ceratobasidium sp. AG-Ba]|nr:Transposase family Tnp2 protein [Ceratobasidium sp. AG-Ba]
MSSQYTISRPVVSSLDSQVLAGIHEKAKKKLPCTTRLIEKHRRNYGRHPDSLDHAGSSIHSPGLPAIHLRHSTPVIPTEARPDSPTSRSTGPPLVPGSPILDATPAPSSPTLPALAISDAASQTESRPRFRSQPLSRSCSGFRSRFQSRSRSQSRSSPQSPGSYLGDPNSGCGVDICEQSRGQGSQAEAMLSPADPAADVELFGRFLYRDQVPDDPPPLRLRGGHQDNDDEQSEGDGNDEGDQGDGPNPEDEDEDDDPPEMHLPPADIEADPDAPGNENDAAHALNEPPTILNIYLRTWALYAFSGVTQDVIQSVLESHKATLLAEARRGDFPAEYLARIQNMATTLRSLERRIGMDFADLITVYPLCPMPECGKRYTLEELNELPDPQCVRHVGELRCHGIMYTELTLVDGTQKRTPTKSFPYNSLPHALSRLLCRTGMTDYIQHWRRPGDEPADQNIPPLMPEDWIGRMNLEDRFSDITEAWGWRSHSTGLQRAWNGEGYEDEPSGYEPLALSRLPFGLSLGLNMDGFQAFRGKFAASGNYSVNGVYIIVNNLPFQLRMLIKNMILAIVIPGPNEPKGYALDQILEPLVNDLIELSNGINLAIYNSQVGRIKNHIVYASLSALFLDWIARIKCTGHAGVAAEYNHCLYCDIRQCYLSLPRGYLSEGFNLRDPYEHLQAKYRWLNAPEEEREEIREQTGTVFVDFDRIPGFYSFDNCPIDAMHLFDLGITPAIVKDILYKHGMFRKRYPQQPPEETPEA